MAQIQKCDRCKKAIDTPNEIGVVLEISSFRTTRGYIRPSKILLDSVKESVSDIEYFPLIFEKELFGELDLCRPCFEDFMKLKS